MEVVQPLYTFGKIESLIDASRSLIDLADARVGAVANEVKRDTARVYYGILLADDLRAQLEMISGRLGGAIETVQEGLKGATGEYTPADEQQLRYFVSLVERRVIEVEANRRKLSDTLKRFIGLSTEDSLILTYSSLPGPLNSLADRANSRETAILLRPELAQLRAAETAQSQLLSSEKADYFPHLFLGGLARYGWAPNRTDQRNPFVRDDYNFWNGGVALGFQYDLSFGRTREEVKKRAAELDVLGAKRRAATVLVLTEVDNAVSDLEMASSILANCREAGRIARRWTAVSESQFDLGLMSTRGLLDAYEAFAESQVSFLEALYEERVAHVNLQFAEGTR